MYAQVEKVTESKSHAVADSVTRKKSDGKEGLQLVDNRSYSIIQREININGKKNTSKKDDDLKFFETLSQKMDAAGGDKVKMYNTMLKSNQIFSYDQEEELLRDITTRLNKVEIAETMSKLASLEFSPSSIDLSNTVYWRPLRKDNRVWGIDESSGAYEAMQELLETNIQVECAAALHILEFLAIAKIYGENEAQEAFDREFKDITIGFSGIKTEESHSREAGSVEKLVREKGREISRYEELVKGDGVYFENNPEYETAKPHGSWMGENAIYMGDKKFYGHGIGIKTASEIIDKLEEEYIKSGGHKKRAKTSSTVTGEYPGMQKWVDNTTKRTSSL